MYENGKMRPVETVLRKGEGKIKEKDGLGESKIYYKQFYLNMVINLRNSFVLLSRK
jgi:hypothetical protein